MSDRDRNIVHEIGEELDRMNRGETTPQRAYDKIRYDLLTRLPPHMPVAQGAEQVVADLNRQREFLQALDPSRPDMVQHALDVSRAAPVEPPVLTREQRREIWGGVRSRQTLGRLEVLAALNGAGMLWLLGDNVGEQELLNRGYGRGVDECLRRVGALDSLASAPAPPPEEAR